MLRAGPFSDERVTGLANRRFVPFFFDLSDRGAAGDPDARRFLVQAQPKFGRVQVPTPPVFFMTPTGEVVGEVSNYASADEVLETMLSVLREHPEWAKPAAEEAGLKGLAKAQLLVDLQDLDGALKVLGGKADDGYRLARGKIHRRSRAWTLMKKDLDAIGDAKLEDQVRMERAYPMWFGRDWPQLEKHLADFPKESARYTEARYYLGLARFHQEKKGEALATWKATIAGCSQDPWIYRSDWAFCSAQQNKRSGSFSSAGPRTSPLNRIGYLGPKNPDLAGPAPRHRTR